MRASILAVAAVAFLTGSGASNAAESPAEAARSNLSLGVDLCLQHVRDRNPVEVFRAAGFTVNDADEGTFDIEAPGVTGFLAPLVLTGWCWVASTELSYAEAETIAFERAAFRYPQGVSGPPQRGMSLEIAPGADCAGLTVLHANRIHTLTVTNVPFWEGCADPATGGVWFD